MKDTTVTACGEWGKSYFLITCVSGPSEPMLVAPSLTTSVSWVMVLAEEWAAWASFSWLDAAPATSNLVSSTRALAVFKMLSLGDGKPMGVNHKRICLLKDKCWNAQCPSVSHWKEVWLLRQYERSAPWHQLICCPFCCTCDQRRSLHSRGSAFQPRQTWWWCPGQRWCQKQRWRLWCRLGCLCSRPAAPTAPKTPGTDSML